MSLSPQSPGFNRDLWLVIQPGWAGVWRGTRLACA